MIVVVATDGSQAAIDAAQHALKLLRPGATIELVMVIPEKEDPLEDAGGIEGPLITPEEADKDWEEAVRLGQAALERTAQAVGPTVDVRLVPADGGTGAGIVKIAEDMKADVLVVGARAKGLLNRIFTRSVSDYVIHHAHCPVLLVRHEG